VLRNACVSLQVRWSSSEDSYLTSGTFVHKFKVCNSEIRYWRANVISWDSRGLKFANLSFLGFCTIFKWMFCSGVNFNFKVANIANIRPPRPCLISKDVFCCFLQASLFCQPLIKMSIFSKRFCSAVFTANSFGISVSRWNNKKACTGKRRNAGKIQRPP